MDNSIKQPKSPPVPQTPASLQALADELQGYSSQLSALAAAIKSMGFESLMVTHADQRRRSMEYIENFTKAVRDALREAREDRGDFGPTAAPEEPKKKPRK